MCDAIVVPMSPNASATLTNGFTSPGCLGILVSLETSLESTRKTPVPWDDLCNMT